VTQLAKSFLSVSQYCVQLSWTRTSAPLLQHDVMSAMSGERLLVQMRPESPVMFWRMGAALAKHAVGLGTAPPEVTDVSADIG
jgi:hypothetical protein